MNKKHIWGVILLLAFVMTVGGQYLNNQAYAAPAAPTANKALDAVQKAYKFEKDASDDYRAFAEKADKDGYGQAASLFRAATASKAMHLGRYLKLIAKMKGVPDSSVRKPVLKSTKENLASAIQTEKKLMEVFPQYIKQAQEGKDKMAAMSMMGANAGAKFSVEYFTDAKKNLDSWKKGTRQFIVCRVCGYFTGDLKLKKCPICGAPRSQFMDVK